MNRLLMIRFIIIFTLFSYTNGFCFFNLESIIIFGFPLFDFSTGILFLYLLLSYNKERKRFTPLNYVIWGYLILSTLIIFSMPFREKESLIDAFHVGRHFYLLLLTFVIEDEIYYSGNFKFIRNLIILLGVFYTSISLANYIFPNFADTFLPGIRNEIASRKGDMTRNVIANNYGIAFVHFSFTLALFSFICNEKNSIWKTFLLIYLFIGLFAVGMRGIMFGTLMGCSIVFLTIMNRVSKWGLNYVLNQFKYFIFAIIIVLITNYLSNNMIFGFADTVINDVTEQTIGSNTFQGREDRALNYQIPQVMRHPYTGLGFIYKGTAAAKKYGHDPSKSNAISNLYTIDFGYGTMWVMFGLIGGSLLMLLFIWSLFVINKYSREIISEHMAQLAAIIISFLICNYTWGVLVYPLGLIILCFTIAIANNYQETFITSINEEEKDPVIK